MSARSRRCPPHRSLGGSSLLVAFAAASSTPAWAGIAGVSTQPPALGCNFATIGAAIAAAPTGATVLPGAYTENWGVLSGKDVSLEPAPADSNCRRPGNLRVSVDAGAARLLSIQLGGSLSMRNFDVVDGASPVAGGGQFEVLFADLVLTNSTLTDGDAVAGGSVLAFGGHVTLQQGSVVSAGSADRGGCFYLNASTEGAPSTLTVLDHSRIEGCTAFGNLPGDGLGGAVYVSAFSSVELLDDAVVTENWAIGGGGGAIYVGPTGSAVIGDGALVTMNDTTDDGGGVYVDGGTLTSSGQAAIRFNDAEGLGGGVYAVGAALDLLGGEVSLNAAVSGGGLYLSGGTATLAGLEVGYNDATGGGGGIWADGADLDLDAVAMPSNAAADGAGVYATGGASAAIHASSLTTNAATGDGGGIYADDAAIAIDAGSTVASNTSGASGGGLACFGCEAVIDGAEVSDNEAAAFGGGVYTDGAADLVATAVTIADNSAASGGGGVYTQCPTTIAAGSVVSGNTTPGSGGGLGCYLCDMDVSDTTLTGNEAGFGTVPMPVAGCTFCGGALAVNGLLGSASVTVSDSVIDDNRAVAGGGVLVAYTADVTLKNVAVTHNRASTVNIDGGGVVVDGGGHLIACNGTTWGAPFVDDNAPDDVSIHAGASYTFPGVQTADCSSATLVCDLSLFQCL